MKPLWNSEKVEKVIAGIVAAFAIAVAATAIYRAHQVANGIEISANHGSAAVFHSGFNPLPQPNPNMTSSDVLGVLLSHFRDVDYPNPNFGVEVAWNFASPANKNLVGDEEQLRRILEEESYKPLISFKMAFVGPAKYEEDQAEYPVLIQTTEGQLAMFLFRFRREAQGEFAECWLTDGVERIPMRDRANRMRTTDEFDRLASRLTRQLTL